MTIWQTTFFSLVTYICFGNAMAFDESSKSVARELCGKTSKAPLNNDLRWDCSGITEKDIDSLESTVGKDHRRIKIHGEETTLYIYNTYPPVSGWVFNGSKAVRYRAVYANGTWQGIGLTTFCSDLPAICEQFETFSASTIPEPFFILLGPPALEPPPISYGK